MSYPHIDRVIRHLWSPTWQEQGLHVYALLDGARDDRIYPALIEACDERNYRCILRGHQAIFLGRLPRVLAEAAPYLVKLDPKTNFARWMISRGWGDNWGIFAISSATLDELLINFRRFLMVKDESGKPFYFRYYDPRVMRAYLPACNVKELKMVFGPVDRYYVEGEDPDTIMEYARVDGNLEHLIVPLVEY